MTSEETIKNQAEEIATLKASIELLKETMTHGLACMKTARDVHKADVAVIRADHKIEVDRLKLAIVSGFECIEKIGVIHGAEVVALESKVDKRDALIRRWVKRTEDGWILERGAINEVW
jgi:hypothetical protein